MERLNPSAYPLHSGISNKLIKVIVKKRILNFFIPQKEIMPTVT